jgi:6,7-dimethyl-8-ribityllumazine synthase
MTKVIEGDFSANTAKFTLVVGRFNSAIVDNLCAGAIDTLRRQGVPAANITVVRVPGAYEMPLAAKRVAAKGETDAIIALGAVIRGGTPHFDFVAGECSSGLARVALDYDLPIAFVCSPRIPLNKPLIGLGPRQATRVRTRQ